MPSKVKVFKVETGGIPMPSNGVRLMRGTLRQVENKLLAEVAVEPCSPEDAHKYHATKIEDVTGEP